MSESLNLEIKNYSREEMLEYLNPETNRHKEKFNSSEFHDCGIQSSIMENWWRWQAFGRTISELHYRVPNEEPEEVTANFVSLLTWDKLINAGSRYWVDINNQNKYAGQSMSWAQFSLLENWSLIKKGHKYIDNLYGALILRNTLGENIYHTLAYTACVQGRGHQIDELLSILAVLPISMIMEKDNSGESPLELLYRLEKEVKIYKIEPNVHRTILDRFELIKEKLDLEKHTSLPASSAVKIGKI